MCNKIWNEGVKCYGRQDKTRKVEITVMENYWLTYCVDIENAKSLWSDMRWCYTCKISKDIEKMVEKWPCLTKAI